MSDSTPKRKELLKLSKTKLIKKCKKYKLSTNGSKSDMVDRLITKIEAKNKKKQKKQLKQKNKNKSMNNKPKSNKFKDIHIELLVFGYAHINEQTLSPPLNIIPLSIIQIFMKYYCIEGDLIIFLAVSQKVDINNPSIWSKQVENKYKYIDFINNRTVTLKYHNVNNTYFDDHSNHNKSSIFAENIPIPSYLYTSQTKINLDNDNKDNEKSFFFNTDSKYSAIIKNQTSIIYINNDEMNTLSKSELDILNGYKASIPKVYSHNSKVKSYLYSMNNGLIHFDTQKIKQLKFDTNTHNFYKWKWKQLASTKSKHENGSLCWIRGYSFTANDSMSNEKIFICGGIYGNCQCELYDIKNNKLISLQNMPNARTDAGCYFDKLNKNVYVGGGGSGSRYCVDCYDFNKNYWYSMCDTAFPHNNNPMLYMNGYILYIVGNGNAIGSIEMYDTRDSDGHWSFARDIQIDDILSKDPCTIYKIMSNKSN